jgi:hypothetical protein
LHLFGEHQIKAEIIAYGREDRAVGRQGNGGQRAAVHDEAVDEFGGQMLRVSGAAAVAAKEQFVSPGQSDGHAQGRICHQRRVTGKKTAAQFRPGFGMFKNSGDGSIGHSLAPG